MATEAGFDSEMLRDHIVFATNFETVPTKCLEVGEELTLDQARHFALTYEHTQRQLKQMNEYTQSVSHEVHSMRKRPPQKEKKNISTSAPSHKSSDNCLNGGGKRHAMRMFPAKNAKCFLCARIGHYANLYLSKKQQVNSVDEMGNSNPYLLMINAKCHTVSFHKPLVNATVQSFTVNNSSNVLVNVDTGADVSILCKPTYVNTFQDAMLIGLDKSAIVLTAYGGTDIEVLGSVTARITVRGNTSSVKFIITDTLSPTYYHTKIV